MNRKPKPTRRGLLFIISAPSGAGKTSLISALVATRAGTTVSISHTTRPIRPSERHGVDYYFVDQPTFAEMIATGSFLEYAKVFDHFYGTSCDWVIQQLEQGMDVILEIDWQGAHQIRVAMPDCISIFILPPSCYVLEQRLIRRGEDGNEIIQQRMCDAVREMSHYHEYDYIVVNEDFHRALADLQAIVQASHLGIKVQRQALAGLLQELIA